MLQLSKYSIGVGDRFAHQAKAQLRACMLAEGKGVDIIPMWNKSNREHVFIGSDPCSVRAAADAAVGQLGWTKPYHVDADHINLETVDRFIVPSDCFTIDVAHFIGQDADSADVEKFVARHGGLIGKLDIAGIPDPFHTTQDSIARVAAKYATAVREAGRIYRHIAARRGEGTFITEVSMGETDVPQSPPELLVILALLADEHIPIQTIAPKFSGRFNKGIDYVGDVSRFAEEFESDIAVVAHAVKHYALPENLKLSVHSGSDKFSIYGAIRRAYRKVDAGVHVKTAGTSWLEELIGLAEAGGEGLALAQEVYVESYAHREALCQPYAAVIDIDYSKLPLPSEVAQWSGEEFTSALRHDPACPRFDRNVRQLLHVGFKIAAKMGDRYLRILEQSEESVARNVTHNMYVRHLKPLFID
jgi:tagaturonate epimerase